MNATHTPAPQLTIPMVRAFYARADVKDAVLDVIAARALAKATRKQVDAYTVPLLATFGIKHAETGETITKPSDLYLSHDEEGCARFFAACDAVHRAHGFALPAGHCPALAAEHAVVKAELRLLDLGAALVGDGVRWMTLDLRARLLGVLMNPPKG